MSEDFESRGDWYKQFFKRGYNLLQDTHDTEDMLQEFFINLMQNRDNYDSSRPFENWIRRVFSNNLIKFLRKKETRVTKNPKKPRTKECLLVDLNRKCEEESENPMDVLYFKSQKRHQLEQSPHQKIAQKETEDKLKESIAKLKPIYRQAIELHYYRGLTPKEIGEEIGIPATNVTSRLYLARNKLRNMLYEFEYGERIVA